MSSVRKPGATLDHPVKRRSAAERFAHLSERLGLSVPGAEPVEAPAAIVEPEYPASDDQDTAWYEVVPRFPVVRSGYDCAAVDQHVAALETELEELEREFDELRMRGPGQDEVAAELQRVGEQTSSILLAAHDRARETARQAQENAERTIAEANASAAAITEEATRKRAEIEVETRRLAERRARLLADMETLAGTLATVAREASARDLHSADAGQVTQQA